MVTTNSGKKKIDHSTISTTTGSPSIINNNAVLYASTISMMNDNNNQTYKYENRIDDTYDTNENVSSSLTTTSYHHFQQQQQQQQQQQNNNQHDKYHYFKDNDENDNNDSTRRRRSKKQNNDFLTHQKHFLQQQQQQQQQLSTMNHTYHINKKTNTDIISTISAATSTAATNTPASPPESDVFNNITNKNSITTQSYIGISSIHTNNYINTTTGSSTSSNINKRIGTPYNNNNNNNNTTGSIIKRRIQTPKSTIQFNHSSIRTSPFQYHPTLNDQQRQQPLRQPFQQHQQFTSNVYNNHTMQMLPSSASSCSSSSSSSSTTENTTDAISSPLSMTFFQSLQNPQQQQQQQQQQNPFDTKNNNNKNESMVPTKRINEIKATTASTSTSTTRRRLKLWSLLFGNNKTIKKINADSNNISKRTIVETSILDSHRREVIDKENRNNIRPVINHQQYQNQNQYQYQNQQQQVLSKRKRQRKNQIISSSYLWTGVNQSPIASFDSEEEEILFSPDINFESNRKYNPIIDTNSNILTNTARQTATAPRVENDNNNQNTVIASDIINNNDLSFTSVMKKLFFPRFYYTNQKRLEQQQQQLSSSNSKLIPQHKYQYKFIDTNDINHHHHQVPNERTSLLLRNKQQLYSSRFNNSYNNNSNNNININNNNTNNNNIVSKYNDLHIRTCSSDVSNQNKYNKDQNNHHLHLNPSDSTERINNLQNTDGNCKFSRKIITIEMLNEQYLHRKVLYLTWGNFVCITSIFYFVCMGFYDWISWIQINDSVNTIIYGINSTNSYYYDNDNQQQEQLQQQQHQRYGISAKNDDYFNTYHLDKAISYMNDKTTNTIQNYLNRRNYNSSSNLDWNIDNSNPDKTVLYDYSFNHEWLYPIGMPPDRTMSIFGSFSSTQTKYVIYESVERLKEHSISHKEKKQKVQIQIQQSETRGIKYNIKLLYRSCCHQLYQLLSTTALCMYYIAYIAMKIIPSWFMCTSIMEWIVLVFIWNYIITYLLDNTRQQQSLSQSHLSLIDTNTATNNMSYQKSHQKQQITIIVLLYISTILVGQLWSITLDAYYSRLVTNATIMVENSNFNDDDTYSNGVQNNSNNSIALILLLYFSRETGCIAWGTIGLLSFFLATLGSTTTSTTSQGLLMPWTKVPTETISKNNINNNYNNKSRVIFLSFVVLILIVIMTQQFVRCRHYNGYYNNNDISTNTNSYSNSDNQSSGSTVLKPILQSKYLILDQVFIVFLCCCLWGYTIGYLPYAINQYNNIRYEEKKDNEMMVLPTITVHSNSNDEDDNETDSYEGFINKNDSFNMKKKASTIMTVMTVSSRYCFQQYSSFKRCTSSLLIQRLHYLIIGAVGYCLLIISLLWLLPIWYLCYV